MAIFVITNVYVVADNDVTFSLAGTRRDATLSLAASEMPFP